MTHVAPLLALCLSLSLTAANHLELHVAVHGNDAHPGTQAQPLATLQGAQKAIRKLKKTGGPLPASITVTVHDGTYLLPAPIHLTEQDSGTARCPITYRALNPGKAIFSGQITLADWRPVTDQTVLRLLPEAARNKVLTTTIPGTEPLPSFLAGGNVTDGKRNQHPVLLFQDSRRMTLARWPNTGFVKTGPCTYNQTKKTHCGIHSLDGVFTFESPKLEKWAQEPDLWLYGLWFFHWADLRSRVIKVDAKAKTIAVDTDNNPYGYKQNADFYAFNALSELDLPGEWVLDRKQRALYLWPVKPVTEAQPVLAFSKHLLVAQKVSHLTLHGLTFQYARQTALLFQDCSHTALQKSIVRHTGDWAVTFKGGTDCRVQGCDLYDLGEGGITLEGGTYRTLTPANHVADNNHIHHYGQVTPNYKPGVQLNGVGNRATHNLIHHSQHQAIAFNGNDHTIAFNVIHDTCTHNDDAGAIYCCQRDWSKRGTVIEHNLIQMTGRAAHPSGNHAIYLDDYSSGITVQGNIVNRADNGIMIGGGHDNIIRQNLLLNCQLSINLSTRGIDSFARPTALLGAKSYLYQNLKRQAKLFNADPWKTKYPKLMAILDYPDPVHAHDAHFNQITRNVMVASPGIHVHNPKWVEPTSVIKDNLSLLDNPGFVDYRRMDYTLKPEAPALKTIGESKFQDMGLYDSPLRISPAVTYSEDATPLRAIGFHYRLPKVRMDFSLVSPAKIPPGMDFARDLQACELPAWGKGQRLVAAIGNAPQNAWQKYQFSFTPNLDATINLELMGEYGDKTAYDDFQVTGTTLLNPDFETDEAWERQDHRETPPRGNVQPPYGIVTPPKDLKPASGKRCALANHERRLVQTITVKKDVPVIITFKARAYIPAN